MAVRHDEVGKHTAARLFRHGGHQAAKLVLACVDGLIHFIQPGQSLLDVGLIILPILLHGFDGQPSVLDFYKFHHFAPVHNDLLAQGTQNRQQFPGAVPIFHHGDVLV